MQTLAAVLVRNQHLLNLSVGKSFAHRMVYIVKVETNFLEAFCKCVNTCFKRSPKAIVANC
jgi:hypothetical protein